MCKIEVESTVGKDYRKDLRSRKIPQEERQVANYPGLEKEEQWEKKETEEGTRKGMRRRLRAKRSKM